MNVSISRICADSSIKMLSNWKGIAEIHCPCSWPKYQVNCNFKWNPRRRTLLCCSRMKEQTWNPASTRSLRFNAACVHVIAMILVSFTSKYRARSAPLRNSSNARNSSSCVKMDLMWRKQPVSKKSVQIVTGRLKSECWRQQLSDPKTPSSILFRTHTLTRAKSETITFCDVKIFGVRSAFEHGLWCVVEEFCERKMFLDFVYVAFLSWSKEKHFPEITPDQRSRLNSMNQWHRRNIRQNEIFSRTSPLNVNLHTFGRFDFAVEFLPPGQHLVEEEVGCSFTGVGVVSLHPQTFL